MPAPYVLVRDPNDATLNGTMDLNLGGKQVHATIQIAKVQKDGADVGMVEVMGFGGMPITDAMFQNGVKGSALSTNGKITWTKINGLKVAVLTSPELHAIEYQRGDVIVMTGAPTSAVALSIATALMSVTGGTTGMPVDVAAGTHITSWFQPRLRYTTPTSAQVSDTVDFLAIGDTGNGGLFVFHNPAALSGAPDCPSSPDPGAGSSAAALAASISARAGLAVSQPAQRRIAGLRAIELEISLRPSWDTTCPFSNGLPAVPLLYRPVMGSGWWVAGSEHLRLDLLDVPGKGTVVVAVDAYDGSGYTDLLARSQAIISSFAFPSK